MGKQTLKERIPAFASILGLLVLIAAYYIVGAIRDANVAYGLKAIVNQSVVVALVAGGLLSARSWNRPRPAADTLHGTAVVVVGEVGRWFPVL